MPMLELIKLINYLFIKRAINVNVVVGPSAICFISLGSTKPVDIKIKGNVNYKEVLKYVRLRHRVRERVNILDIFA